jgi:hypothetical protein
VYELSRYSLTYTYSFKEAVLSLGVSHDASTLAVGLENGNLSLRKQSRPKLPPPPGQLPAPLPLVRKASLCMGERKGNLLVLKKWDNKKTVSGFKLKDKSLCLSCLGFARVRASTLRCLYVAASASQGAVLECSLVLVLVHVVVLVLVLTLVLVLYL